ncbi:MAG: glycosyltransferase family 9 protein [Alphaproteobacteria bacterium]|nr:glycosyltransferase family 9 protein [Alphaproteobacteria bacterium]
MKILFITATRIGDAVLSTGLLDHLIRQHPDARFTVACGPDAAPLFAEMPQLERLIPMSKERWSKHWMRLWWACIGTRWDLVIDLRKSLVAYLLSSERRYTLSNSREPVHRVRLIADVMDLPETPMPHIWVREERLAEAARLLPGPEPVLAVGPTTNWLAKTWRAENFMTLIDRLTGPGGILPGAKVAVFGAPHERPQAQPVIDALAPTQVIDLVGRIDLLTVYACLERCAFYIGNDSALMHLAAASGIPTLGLFGPSSEIFYAPWGWHAAVARTPESFDNIFPKNFDHRSSGTLMDSLTVDMAEEAARNLWSRTQAQTRAA